MSLILKSFIVFIILTACQHRPTLEEVTRPEEPQTRPQESAPAPPKVSKPIFSTLALPLVQAPQSKGDLILDHKYFVISYDPASQGPRWVLYRLTGENLKQHRARRKNRFIADPLLRQKGVVAVAPGDYDGRTYDRGHMAPSDDFTFSQAANDETFVMTNMIPQKRALNRGGWKKLESRIRKWACTEKQVRIVTGPMAESTDLKMTSGVPVPRRFFKLVLDETPPRKAIAFVYAQEDAKSSPEERTQSLDELERQTGYVFFPDLEARERRQIGAKADVASWIETDCRRFAQ